MSIGAKVQLGFGMLFALLAAFGWFTIAQTTNLDREFRQVTQDMLAIGASGDYALAISQVQDLEVRALMANDEAKRRELQAEAKRVREYMRQIEVRLRKLLTSWPQQAALDEMLEHLEAYRNAQAIGDLTDLDKQTERMIEASRTAAVATTRRARVGMMTAVLVAAVLFLALTLATNRYILRDVRRLIAAVNTLSGGDLETEIPGTTRRDELGDVARALEHFRATAQQKERLQRQDDIELAMARAIQLAGVPHGSPVLSGAGSVDICGRLAPSRSVSGDFIDYYQLDSHRLAVIIGDASGHGVSSAMFAGWALGTLKSESMRVTSPARCLAATNRRLAANNDSLMFVTAFYGVIDFADGSFSFANAGHYLPYLLGKTGGMQSLAGDPGLPLGIDKEFDFEDRQVRLNPGDAIVLFTDGVIEAAAPSGKLFGRERLEDFLVTQRNARCESLVDELLATLRGFSDGTSQSDDIAILAVRYKDAPKLVLGTD